MGGSAQGAADTIDDDMPLVTDHGDDVIMCGAVEWLVDSANLYTSLQREDTDEPEDTDDSAVGPTPPSVSVPKAAAAPLAAASPVAAAVHVDSSQQEPSSSVQPDTILSAAESIPTDERGCITQPLVIHIQGKWPFSQLHRQPGQEEPFIRRSQVIAYLRERAPALLNDHTVGGETEPLITHNCIDARRDDSGQSWKLLLYRVKASNHATVLSIINSTIEKNRALQPVGDGKDGKEVKGDTVPPPLRWRITANGMPPPREVRGVFTLQRNDPNGHILSAHLRSIEGIPSIKLSSVHWCRINRQSHRVVDFTVAPGVQLDTLLQPGTIPSGVRAFRRVRPQKVVCFRCQQEGHTTADCQEHHPRCRWCHSKEHLSNGCSRNVDAIACRYCSDMDKYKHMSMDCPQIQPFQPLTNAGRFQQHGPGRQRSPNSNTAAPIRRTTGSDTIIPLQRNITTRQRAKDSGSQRKAAEKNTWAAQVGSKPSGRISRRNSTASVDSIGDVRMDHLISRIDKLTQMVASLVERMTSMEDRMAAMEESQLELKKIIHKNEPVQKNSTATGSIKKTATSANANQSISAPGNSNGNSTTNTTGTPTPATSTETKRAAPSHDLSTDDDHNSDVSTNQRRPVAPKRPTTRSTKTNITKDPNDTEPSSPASSSSIPSLSSHKSSITTGKNKAPPATRARQ